ncbi:hypothetical protein R3P38DRAFT_3260739 [Favolaschia claudopus]|uniref:Fungal N-terminal domain-containing protein n=1 Tax=Favolaschia claudopus TaxID=2862362 RepID=A0AAW0CUN7_9AGAR
MHRDEPYDICERRQIVLDSRQSTRQDWLAGTILTLKTIAATAEVATLPYIRAVLGTVVILLETVEKMKKNRDDLLDLCASIVEIILLVKDELSCHGEAVGTRLAGLCEEFISLLRDLQTGLEHLLRKRAGIKGWLYDSLRVESVADQIQRYRYRINEVRTNFMLIATLNSNLHIANIQRTVTGVENVSSQKSEFRQIALGDVNLLHEIAISGKANAVKVFIARVTGQPSLMTVAQYEADTARWKSDLEEYSRIRHPHVWQLFGFVSSPGLNALLFHDEIIPLATYRQFHRPSADLVWAAVEGLLFQQFKETAQYHYWPSSLREQRSRATICVKQKPLRICLTMPDMTNQSSIVDLDTGLSSWHHSWFKAQRFHQRITTDCNTLRILDSYLAAELSSDVIQRIDLKNFLATLLPIYFTKSIPFGTRKQLFLGSIVGRRYHDDTLESFTPLYESFVPEFNTFSIQDWEPRAPVGLVDRESPTANRFTFQSGSFKAGEIPEELIKSIVIADGADAVGLSQSNILFRWSVGFDESLTNRLNLCWLSQANFLLRDIIASAEAVPGARYGYGITDQLLCLIVMDSDFHHLLRPTGTLMKTHLFLQSPIVRREASRIGVDFSESSQWYWSLDPSGETPMSQAECDAIGVPRLQFRLAARGRFWHEYHYNAIRQFVLAKFEGVDPYSQDVPRIFGVPVAKII